MSLPPASLVWPQGLAKKDVPSPQDLMLLDENVRDASALADRLAAAYKTLSHWSAFPLAFAQRMRWDSYYKQFVYSRTSGGNCVIYKSKNAMLELDGVTNSTITGGVGCEVLSLAVNGTGTTVVVLGDLSGIVKIASSTNGYAYTERTFIEAHSTMGRGNVVWTGSSFLFSNGVNSPETSVDGTTWAVTATDPTYKHFQMAVDPATGTILTCSFTGYSISTNNGATWTNTLWAVPFVSFHYFSDAVFDAANDRFIVPGKDATGPCLFTVDRASKVQGATVRPTFYSTADNVVRVFMLDDVMAVCYEDVLYLSGDGGVTIHPVPGILMTDIGALQMVNGQIFYDATSVGYISAPYVR